MIRWRRRPPRTESATASCAGGRSVNQDFVAGWEEGDAGIWVVADGLGGFPGSEAAARAAVEAALDRFIACPGTDGGTLRALVDEAHRAVLGAQGPSASPLRTTLAVLARRGRDVGWVHVGDTRVYRFSGWGGETVRTRDHSVPQMLAVLGEIADADIRRHPARNQITRALGQEPRLAPTTSAAPAPLRAGDAFLLCTDGWWEHVLDEEMVDDLRDARSPTQWLARMEARVEARAPHGHDNYSAAAVMVRRS